MDHLPLSCKGASYQPHLPQNPPPSPRCMVQAHLGDSCEWAYVKCSQSQEMDILW